MRNPKGMKREFLEKWMKGLKKFRCLNNNHHMSLLERKNAIKLSANLAMASTSRSRATRWSRALIHESRRWPERPRVVMKNKRDNNNNKNIVKVNTTSLWRMRMVKKKKKKNKTCSRVMNMMSLKKKKNWLMVEKRKRKLKSLLPGAESMKDDVALIEETLDYIQSLQTQVEVMRSLANFN